MHTNQRGETLVSVIVGVLLIVIIIASITRVISIHYSIEDEYVRNQTLALLQNNTTNIIRKIDTSSVSEKELFSVYKDSTLRRLQVMTGASVDTYKYIDSGGGWVSNTGSFTSTVYIRLLLVDRSDTSLTNKQVIKAEIRELIRAK